MSGAYGPCNWQEDDSCSHNEGVARCARSDCRAPLRIEFGQTLLYIRCEQRHVSEIHAIYPEEFAR
jgi:hypothetical protein